METHSVWGLAELISRILIEAVILCHIVVCVQVDLQALRLLTGSWQIGPLPKKVDSWPWGPICLEPTHTFQAWLPIIQFDLSTMGYVKGP